MHAEQLEAPDAEYDPVPHKVQDAEPLIAVKVPAGQGKHWACPEESRYSPTAHRMHCVAPMAGPYWPRGQGVH